MAKGCCEAHVCGQFSELGSKAGRANVWLFSAMTFLISVAYGQASFFTMEDSDPGDGKSVLGAELSNRIAAGGLILCAAISLALTFIDFDRKRSMQQQNAWQDLLTTSAAMLVLLGAGFFMVHPNLEQPTKYTGFATVAFIAADVLLSSARGFSGDELQARRLQKKPSDLEGQQQAQPLPSTDSESRGDEAGRLLPQHASVKGYDNWLKSLVHSKQRQAFEKQCCALFRMIARGNMVLVLQQKLDGVNTEGNAPGLDAADIDTVAGCLLLAVALGYLTVSLVKCCVKHEGDLYSKEGQHVAIRRVKHRKVFGALLGAFALGACLIYFPEVDHRTKFQAVLMYALSALTDYCAYSIRFHDGDAMLKGQRQVSAFN